MGKTALFLAGGAPNMTLTSGALLALHEEWVDKKPGQTFDIISMAGAGAVLYVIAAGAGAPRASRWGIPVFMTLLTGLTWTQLFMTTPPVPAQLAVNWMAAPLVFGVVVYTLDRKRARGALG